MIIKVKRVITILLALVISITSVTSVAAEKQNTNDPLEELSNQEVFNIYALCDSDVFGLAFANYIVDHMTKSNGKVASKQKATFDFSNVKKRRYVLKWQGINGLPYADEYVTDSSVDTLSKALFGKSTSAVSVLHKSINIENGHPSIESLVIGTEFDKLGKNKYRLTCPVYMNYANFLTDEMLAWCDCLGFVDYTIRKKSHSHYGFIIEKAVVYTSTKYERERFSEMDGARQHSRN